MITVRTIQNAVAEELGVDPAIMTGCRGRDEIARCRQVAMYLARQLTDHSYTNLARFFGGRDHSTIIYGVQQVEQRIVEDPKLALKVRTLRLRLVSTEIAKTVDKPIPLELAEAA